MRHISVRKWGKSSVCRVRKRCGYIRSGWHRLRNGSANLTANVAGTLDDEKFAMMSKNYTQEQKDLKAEVRSLQQEIEEQERQADNLEQFIQRVKRNSDLTELTPYALRELVKGIYVEAPDKSSGKRKQKIHISYDLIGFIPVDVLLKAEQV